MSQGLSLYLDLLRFGLAMTVWIGHAAFRGYVGRPFALWFIYDYGATAVMGFFVLSGFVIAYVTERKEADPAVYAGARIARLYSVVMPALILTAVCDALGMLLDPDFAHIGPAPLPDQQPLRYLLSFLMIQNFWIFQPAMIPGTNYPFWSLSYEAIYYAIFGLSLLPRKLPALVAALLILLIAGPDITLLALVWCLGVVLFRYRDCLRMPTTPACVLFLASLVLITYAGSLRIGCEGCEQRPLLRVIDGMLFGANIVAAKSMSGILARLLNWCAPVVRWLGSLTFAVYLCHAPLLQFFTVFKAGEPGTWIQHAWLFGASFVVMVAVSTLSDRLRSVNSQTSQYETVASSNGAGRTHLVTS